MPEFLELMPPNEALIKLMSHLPETSLSSEEVLAKDALGRVTAQAVLAPHPLPEFPRSTVDGYAVRSVDTFGSSDSLPAYLTLVGEVPMGDAPNFTIGATQAALIHTGGMLPDGADAVVMLENSQVARPGELEVMRPVATAENILRAGEDVSAGQVVIEAGVRLRPAEIGGLMALGIQQVCVTRLPRVAVLSSGDEVVPPDQRPKPGQVRDINSYSLGALVRQGGGESVHFGIIPDRVEDLRRVMREALNACDMVIITAGSSASTRDLTSQVIQEMGEPGVLVHGVNVRPGKPTILAVCNGKAVIGLPGNPVSALVIAGLFVTPLLERLAGVTTPRLRAMISARLTINLASQAGREDWLPVRLIPTPDGYDADPIFFKSNLIFNLARADGLAKIPADANGISAGEAVWVSLL
ncbi:MAG: gephyrin-like molybdotransferase Glp [Anaerolineaceae bacterium]